MIQLKIPTQFPEFPDGGTNLPDGGLKPGKSVRWLHDTWYYDTDKLNDDTYQMILMRSWSDDYDYDIEIPNEN